MTSAVQRPTELTQYMTPMGAFAAIPGNITHREDGSVEMLPPIWRVEMNAIAGAARDLLVNGRIVIPAAVVSASIILEGIVIPPDAATNAAPKIQPIGPSKALIESMNLDRLRPRAQEPAGCGCSPVAKELKAAAAKAGLKHPTNGTH